MGNNQVINFFNQVINFFIYLCLGLPIICVLILAIFYEKIKKESASEATADMLIKIKNSKVVNILRWVLRILFIILFIFILIMILKLLLLNMSTLIFYGLIFLSIILLILFIIDEILDILNKKIPLIKNKLKIINIKNYRSKIILVFYIFIGILFLFKNINIKRQKNININSQFKLGYGLSGELIHGLIYISCFVFLIIQEVSPRSNPISKLQLYTIILSSILLYTFSSISLIYNEEIFINGNFNYSSMDNSLGVVDNKKYMKILNDYRDQCRNYFDIQNCSLEKLNSDLKEEYQKIIKDTQD